MKIIAIAGVVIATALGLRFIEAFEAGARAKTVADIRVAVACEGILAEMRDERQRRIDKDIVAAIPVGTPLDEVLQQFAELSARQTDRELPLPR